MPDKIRDLLRPIRGCATDAQYQEVFSRVEKEIKRLESQVDNLVILADKYFLALEFYADPGTYFAWAFISDPPCGDWGTDFSETDGLGWKPGKRARRALD